jgi:hypothetical protein
MWASSMECYDRRKLILPSYISFSFTKASSSEQDEHGEEVLKFTYEVGFFNM